MSSQHDDARTALNAMLMKMIDTHKEITPLVTSLYQCQTRNDLIPLLPSIGQYKQMLRKLNDNYAYAYKDLMKSISAMSNPDKAREEQAMKDFDSTSITIMEELSTRDTVSIKRINYYRINELDRAAKEAKSYISILNLPVDDPDKTIPYIEDQSLQSTLPPIEIPLFDGEDRSKYSSFITTFNTLVNDRDLKPIEKSNYLNKYLSGTALQLIQMYPQDGSFYKESIELLNSEYANSKENNAILCKQLLYLQAKSNRPEDQLELARQLLSLTLQIKQLNKSTTNEGTSSNTMGDTLQIMQIIHKFAPRYQHDILDNNKDNSVDEVLKYVHDRIRREITLRVCTSHNPNNNKYSNPRDPPPRDPPFNTNNSSNPTNPINNNNDDHRQTSIYHSYNNDAHKTSIRMFTVQTSVQHPIIDDNQLTVDTLLDSGASTTMITKSLADRLQLPVVDKQIQHLQLATGISTKPKEYEFVRLSIKLNDRRIIPIKAMVIDGPVANTFHIHSLSDNDIQFIKDKQLRLANDPQRHGTLTPQIILNVSDMFRILDSKSTFTLPSGLNLHSSILGYISSGHHNLDKQQIDNHHINNVDVVPYTTEESLEEQLPPVLAMNTVAQGENLTETVSRKQDVPVEKRPHDSIEIKNNRHTLQYDSRKSIHDLPDNYGTPYHRSCTTYDKLSKNQKQLEYFDSLIKEQGQIELVSTNVKDVSMSKYKSAWTPDSPPEPPPLEGLPTICTVSPITIDLSINDLSTSTRASPAPSLFQHKYSFPSSTSRPLPPQRGGIHTSL